MRSSASAGGFTGYPHDKHRGHSLVEVWIAVRVSLRSVLERVTLADLVTGTLPAGVKELTDAGDAWVSRSAGGHTPPPPARRQVGPADHR
jgi:hypothetical protein